MIVLGQKEVEDGTVSIRRRDTEELTTLSLEDFVSSVKAEITERRLS
jgi:threonyl-tRNA synthetase